MALTEVVVAYDVASDDDRARLAARLSRCGVRLQRSVFQCQVDPATLDVLIEEWTSLIDLETDVMHVFRQCAPCCEGRHDIGQAPVGLGVRYWII